MLAWLSVWSEVQIIGTPTTPPSYIWVRAVVWASGHGQTDTDARDHNTFCVVYNSHEM